MWSHLIESITISMLTVKRPTIIVNPESNNNNIIVHYNENILESSKESSYNHLLTGQ